LIPHLRVAFFQAAPLASEEEVDEVNELEDDEFFYMDEVTDNM
jgi:hypothetical protein